MTYHWSRGSAKVHKPKIKKRRLPPQVIASLSLAAHPQPHLDASRMEGNSPIPRHPSHLPIHPSHPAHPSHVLPHTPHSSHNPSELHPRHGTYAHRHFHAPSSVAKLPRLPTARCRGGREEFEAGTGLRTMALSTEKPFLRVDTTTPSPSPTRDLRSRLSSPVGLNTGSGARTSGLSDGRDGVVDQKASRERHPILSMSVDPSKSAPTQSRSALSFPSDSVKTPQSPLQSFQSPSMAGKEANSSSHSRLISTPSRGYPAGVTHHHSYPGQRSIGKIWRGEYSRGGYQQRAAFRGNDGPQHSQSYPGRSWRPYLGASFTSNSNDVSRGLSATKSSEGFRSGRFLDRVPERSPRASPTPDASYNRVSVMRSPNVRDTSSLHPARSPIRNVQLIGKEEIWRERTTTAEGLCGSQLTKRNESLVEDPDEDPRFQQRDQKAEEVSDIEVSKALQVDNSTEPTAENVKHHRASIDETYSLQESRRQKEAVMSSSLLQETTNTGKAFSEVSSPGAGCTLNLSVQRVKPEPIASESKFLFCRDSPEGDLEEKKDEKVLPEQAVELKKSIKTTSQVPDDLIRSVDNCPVNRKSPNSSNVLVAPSDSKTTKETPIPLVKSANVLNSDSAVRLGKTPIERGLSVPGQKESEREIFKPLGSTDHDNEESLSKSKNESHVNKVQDNRSDPCVRELVQAPSERGSIGNIEYRDTSKVINKKQPQLPAVDEVKRGIQTFDTNSVEMGQEKVDVKRITNENSLKTKRPGDMTIEINSTSSKKRMRPPKYSVELKKIVSCPNAEIEFEADAAIRDNLATAPFQNDGGSKEGREMGDRKRSIKVENCSIENDKEMTLEKFSNSKPGVGSGNTSSKVGDNVSLKSSYSPFENKPSAPVPMVVPTLSILLASSPRSRSKSNYFEKPLNSFSRRTNPPTKVPTVSTTPPIAAKPDNTEKREDLSKEMREIDSMIIEHENKLASLKRGERGPTREESCATLSAPKGKVVSGEGRSNLIHEQEHFEKSFVQCSDIQNMPFMNRVILPMHSHLRRILLQNQAIAAAANASLRRVCHDTVLGLEAPPIQFRPPSPPGSAAAKQIAVAVSRERRECYDKQRRVFREHAHLKKLWMKRLKAGRERLSKDRRDTNRERDRFLLLSTRGQSALLTSRTSSGRMSTKIVPSVCGNGFANGSAELDAILTDIEAEGGTPGSKDIWSRTLATIPNQDLGKRPIDCQSALIDNPIADLYASRSVNPWMLHEIVIFLEKFTTYPKNFRKIASFLGHKSSHECARFYFEKKLDFGLKQLVKESSTLKRKGLLRSHIVAIAKKRPSQDNCIVVAVKDGEAIRKSAREAVEMYEVDKDVQLVDDARGVEEVELRKEMMEERRETVGYAMKLSERIRQEWCEVDLSRIEHAQFMAAFRKFGTDWKALRTMLGNDRVSSLQVREYYRQHWRRIEAEVVTKLVAAKRGKTERGVYRTPLLTSSRFGASPRFLGKKVSGKSMRTSVTSPHLGPGGSRSAAVTTRCSTGLPSPHSSQVPGSICVVDRRHNNERVIGNGSVKTGKCTTTDEDSGDGTLDERDDEPSGTLRENRSCRTNLSHRRTEQNGSSSDDSDGSNE